MMTPTQERSELSHPQRIQQKYYTIKSISSCVFFSQKKTLHSDVSLNNESKSESCPAAVAAAAAAVAVSAAAFCACCAAYWAGDIDIIAFKSSRIMRDVALPVE